MQTQLRHTLMLLWLSVMIMLSACGGGDDPADDAAPPPPPANAMSQAGPDQDISIGQSITLDGTGSNDPDGDSLTYRWTQTYGPDVTGGTGSLSGATPSFNAPNTVSSLQFELTVNDGHGDSTADQVQINILEDAAHALFVDDKTGSDDTGDGSRANPFASIRHALTQVTPDQEDIYVVALTDESQRYDESSATLNVPAGTSLYGAFNSTWVRDVVKTPTRVLGAAVAINFTTINAKSWISGFDLQTVDGSTPSASLYAIRALDGATGTLVIENNTITTGHAAAGTSTTPGSNYGVFASNLAGLEVYRNTLTIGNAANGAWGTDMAKAADGKIGANASGTSGGAGGASGHPSGSTGGKGGIGGTGILTAGGDGENGKLILGGIGGKGGVSKATYAEGGKGGIAGATGSLGLAGKTDYGFGAFGSAGYIPQAGGPGSKAARGGNGGAGGGGGSSAADFTINGGGGGGGGGGGAGGDGGLGGHGGGASIGIYTYAISGQTILQNNTITAGKGGQAGGGGRGGQGGTGGDGGDGASGACSAVGCWFDNTGSGGGGAGGRGGSGGGGAAGGIGGPSFAVVIGANMAALFGNNTIISAQAGNGQKGGAGGSAGYGGSWGNGGSGGAGGGGGDSGGLGVAGTPGNGGHGGWSYAVFDADPADGLVPTMSNNSLVFGTAGTAGGSDGLAGQAGEANFPY